MVCGLLRLPMGIAQQSNLKRILSKPGASYEPDAAAVFRATLLNVLFAL
jgi:hypothetical protein